MPSTTSKIITTAVGRRKTAIALVRLASGDGSITVNGLPAEKYFPGAMSKMHYEKPFKAAEVKKYSVSAKVLGGGPNGQLDALVLGISRALVKAKEGFRPLLRKEGLLTRDPRARQRRMVGTGGKARRQKQSPKR
ncbi:MAG: 30S ribosomal protein S9 [bacterium]|nr:30S ribosomal protein S9 [bacterium]